jgi:hypothetical protein
MALQAELKKMDRFCDYLYEISANFGIEPIRAGTRAVDQ